MEYVEINGKRHRVAAKSVGIKGDQWKYAVLAEPEEESHPSADLLMQLAREAQEDKDFYKNWEIYLSNICEWETSTNAQEVFYVAAEDTQKVRKKPKTININGYEVPEPIREEPNCNDVVWVTSVVNDEIQSVQWYGVEVDYKNLKNGLLHTTKEAAEKHRAALLSFTREN